ncbi:hypothetical protein NW766_006436 [Fusarium irregulare]|uniref:Uncharacterized protein n=1 Tax=Fusarium irregulare TaxID=2494466 RepID=A0A9W8PQI8_9HYPO|nr:hypothetical protein NW766_006436 [Fusarium irregulare]
MIACADVEPEQHETQAEPSQAVNILQSAIKLSIFFFYAALAAIARSAALSKRQSVATCFGDKGPNLNDCDSLISLLGWTGTSNDFTYSLEVLSRAIERPGFRQKVGPSLPSRSSYTVTKGEANTISVGASFEISGGFFEVFEAGVSASFESSHSVENSQSTQINVDCGSGKNGQIYWVPKWDHYEGTFMPSNTFGEVWNPLDDSAADYMIECQG